MCEGLETVKRSKGTLFIIYTLYEQNIGENQKKARILYPIWLTDLIVSYLCFGTKLKAA